MTAGLAGRTFPIVLAAPSGAGKTTIARALRERRSDVVFSVSATTRPPRPGERDGVDYHFVDTAGFRGMIERGELIEWAEVHGNLYGTPLHNVTGAVGRGGRVVAETEKTTSFRRSRSPRAAVVVPAPEGAARTSGKVRLASGPVTLRSPPARGGAPLLP